MTLTEVKPATGYEVRITQSQSGSYTGQVYKNGVYCSGGTFVSSRDEVIEKAKEFVEWHKNADTGTEVVTL